LQQHSLEFSLHARNGPCALRVEILNMSYYSEFNGSRHLPAKAMSEPRLIPMPNYSDARGSLAVLEWSALPFRPQRLYFLYDTLSHAMRGGHSHGRAEELMLAVSGSFKVTTRKGTDVREFRLESRREALYVPREVWHQVQDFSRDAVCVVLSSEPYDPADLV
jgi:dTDP-4-dehydrorhamnose 3,5-epimerase-like enzyme